MNQSITLSSSNKHDQHPDPDDSVHKSDDDDVTFRFNQIQINANDVSQSLQLTPEQSPEKIPEVSPESKDEGNDFAHQSETADVTFTKNDSKSPESDDVDQTDVDDTFGFNKIQNDTKSPENDDVTKTEDDVSDDDEDDEEGEFTFMCLNDNNDDVTMLYDNDEIRTVFPLFDQSLLYNADNDNGKRINVPVNNVFIESPQRSSHSGESSSTGTSTFTAVSSSTDSNEINIKSNSTGFSKLWRFRDNNNMNRSHSDGRDAFVFLNQTTTPSVTQSKDNDRVSDGGKGKSKDVKKKVKKVKESAHEVYLKQKGGKSEEEKRKSYLPYRPGLMGFFTNVNGGLSKNVHPF